ncbi:hypothetical protein E1292_31735 [Nonomuraea deserti]|uniref:Uncharacterized protein n=1 Tax=Nonomuraea deserti TaxID=1848322 RepID=A0A4R4VI27_9ACTN|nr:hypothetical protein [Nonomuraea deserti]TDC99439.1 hypothetical protein E1292_31735 [Nonomuraea deserti]
MATGWQAGFDGLQKDRFDVGEGGVTGVQHGLKAGTSNDKRQVTAYTVNKITKVDPWWPGASRSVPQSPFSHRTRALRFEVPHTRFRGQPNGSSWEPVGNPISGAGSDPTVSE